MRRKIASINTHIGKYESGNYFDETLREQLRDIIMDNVNAKIEKSQIILDLNESCERLPIVCILEEDCGCIRPIIGVYKIYPQEYTTIMKKNEC